MKTRTSFGVIINAGSGTEAIHNKLSAVKDAFKTRGLAADFYLVNKASTVTDAVNKALAKKHGIIVAVGGDGTINGVASQLLHNQTKLGIIPMGTFNHLARDLKIPLDIPSAIDVLATGKSETIDAGMVNGRVFLNNSSIGLYTKLVHYREEQQKAGWSKRYAIVQAMASVLKKYSFLNVEVEIKNRTKLFKTPIIFIGNNEYDVEGFDVGSRFSVRDGKLSVYIVKHSGRVSFILLCLRSLVGRLRGHTQFTEYMTKRVTLKTRKRTLRVAIDGEIVSLQTPLNYSVKEKALRVIIPH